jgi:DNA excision repair protein ERCC-3
VDAYKKTNSSDLIHTANPRKFKVLQYLLKKHSYCRDKILVFCDRPKVLEYYAKKLKIPYIHGEVSEEERVKIYNLFKTTNDINILFLSRVGDTAIDLPCANVGIQLGMHYKSRRQEVQRMGRIMRAKENPNN